MILVLSYVYSLPLRQTEGFVKSLFILNGSQLSVPDYTTLSRRRKSLDVSKKLKKWNGKENIVFALDSSGLKCCGEKEWMQINHRPTRRRKFIKIHAGINVSTRHILYNKSTTSRVSDISILPDTVEKVGTTFKKFIADGGYDSKSSNSISKPEVEAVIPPRVNAVKDTHASQRNQAIDYISEHSKSRWKREVGYHDRAIVENTFSRWKTIFGENVTAKTRESE